MTIRLLVPFLALAGLLTLAIATPALCGNGLECSIRYHQASGPILSLFAIAIGTLTLRWG